MMSATMEDTLSAMLFARHCESFVIRWEGFDGSRTKLPLSSPVGEVRSVLLRVELEGAVGSVAVAVRSGREFVESNSSSAEAILSLSSCSIA